MVLVEEGDRSPLQNHRGATGGLGAFQSHPPIVAVNIPDALLLRIDQAVCCRLPQAN